MNPFRLTGLMVILSMALVRMAPAQESQAFESPLRPGDVVAISVWPDTSLSGQFTVESDGQVYLPFLGNVQASGVSIEGLRTRIREGFQAAQRNAVVTVTPLYRIGVTGAVARPGLYLVPPTDGFFDVIATAGGFALRSDQSKVGVVREGQVINLNAEEAIKTGDLLPLEALALQSGDQILVPFAPEGLRPRDWISIANLLISTVLLIDRLQD
jgi:polysaccharide export outer membrane protein